MDIRGLERVKRQLDEGRGVLINPNHSAHADPLVMYAAADELGLPLYFMAAWQSFAFSGPLTRWTLRTHGCFSVDREGTDMRAFRQAVEILEKRRHPLVIFPEGEIYHLNDRVTPFRDGAAAIAVAAARRASRPVDCVPCAIKYSYLEDPTSALVQLMDELERQIFWRPRPGPLPERIYRFAEGALALKELEYLGETKAGPLPERIQALSESILSGIEERYAVPAAGGTLPERVKKLRQRAIKRLEDVSGEPGAAKPIHEDLDDLYLVVQLFSYPGDYVADRPTVERLAETLDKFEEDILNRRETGRRGKRRAVIQFGESVEVPGSREKDAVPKLTHVLEERVQELLDGINSG